MRNLLVPLFFVVPSLSFASVDCEEKIVQLISHSNGQVYFMTDSVCTANWCQLAWTDASRVGKGYSMLLAAKSAERKVWFRWANLNSCSGGAPLYTSPDYMYLK